MLQSIFVTKQSLGKDFYCHNRGGGSGAGKAKVAKLGQTAFHVN